MARKLAKNDDQLSLELTSTVGLPPNPNCTRCALHKSAETVCMKGVGPKNADIVVIGEAPGATEDRKGIPLYGRSGQLLRGELHKARLTEPFITNVVRCRPPDNRKPTPEEIKACRPYLDYELATIKPKYVVTCGAIPSKVVLKKPKVTEARGRMIPVPGFPNITGMPMFHPAYALRDPSKLPMITSDLQRLRRHERGELEEKEIKWTVVTWSNVVDFLLKFRRCGEFSFDIETNGLFPYDDKGKISCISIGMKDGGWVIPWHPVHPKTGFGEATREATTFFNYVLHRMIDLQEELELWACGQNAKFDNTWLKAKCGRSFYLDFDTLLAHHLLDENSAHDLKFMARQYLDVEDYDLTTREKRGFVEPMKLYEYGAKDAVYTLRLAQILRKDIKKDIELSRLYYFLTMPSSRALERIEARGIPLDMEFYSTVEKETREKHTAVKRELREMVAEVRRKIYGKKPWRQVNWNSPQQVAKFLYEECGIKATVLTDKGAPSTGEAALADLKGKYPIVDKLIEYRELEKFLSTYIGNDGTENEEASGWKAFIVNNRLHLSYKIAGTVTGRFSSRLHQIPRDGRIRNIATGYVDERGRKWVFAQGDISQAELRIAGHLSQDIELITAYRRGIDVHWSTLLFMIGTGNSEEYLEPAIKTAEALARKKKKLPLHEAIEILRQCGHEAAIAVNRIWKEGRKKAKAVNFGFIYGMYENKFIETAKLKYGWEPTWDEAHAIREAYFELYPGLVKWHERTRKLVAIDGYVTSLSGRKRRLPGVYSSDRSLKNEAERQAINSPVQGFIGDYKAMCMIEIEEDLDHDKVVIVGEHHDALLFLMREDAIAEVAPQVNAIMKAPKLLKKFRIDLSIPMESDLEIGNWGKGVEYKKWLKQREAS